MYKVWMRQIVFASHITTHLTMRRRRFEENWQQLSSEITNKAAGYRRKIIAGDLVEFKFGNSDIYEEKVDCGDRHAGTGR